MTLSPPTPEYDRQTPRGSRIPFLALRITWPFIWGTLVGLFVLLVVLVIAYNYPNEDSRYFFNWFFEGGMFLSINGILGCGLLIYFWIVFHFVFKAYQRRRAVFVLGYLDQAIRLNLPLPRFLSAAARSERAGMKRSLASLERALSTGTPLAAALAQSVHGISPRAVALIAAGEETGALAPTLARLVIQDRAPREADFERRAFLFFYPCFMPLFFILFVTGYMIFLVPKFREIFNDFRVDAPPAFTWLLAVASWVVNESGPLSLLALILVVVWLIGRPIGKWFDFFGLYKNARRRSVVGDALLWHLPVAHGLARDRGWADILAVVAGATRAGMPLPEALRKATTLDINCTLLRRTERLEMALRRGTPLVEAAHLARLPKIVSGMWSTAQASASFPETCDFLSRYYRSRFHRTTIFLQAAVEPLVVFIMAGLVSLFALSLFTSLTRLYAAASGQWSVL